jgi:hypothetical protein
MHLHWIVDLQKIEARSFSCILSIRPSQLHQELKQFEMANLGPKKPMASEPCSNGIIGFKVPSWQDEHFVA